MGSIEYLIQKNARQLLYQFNEPRCNSPAHCFLFVNVIGNDRENFLSSNIIVLPSRERERENTSRFRVLNSVTNSIMNEYVERESVCV